MKVEIQLELVARAWRPRMEDEKGLPGQPGEIHLKKVESQGWDACLGLSEFKVRLL